jgi:hypothetical protein
LIENLKNIKTIQELINENEKQISTLKEKYEESIKPMVEALNTLKDKLEKEKALIREIVLKKFDETKEKKYEGGVAVREYSKLSYDENEVFKWALEKKMFLSLDKKAFEKVAENIGAPTVVVMKKPDVTFPKEIKLED